MVVTGALHHHNRHLHLSFQIQGIAHSCVVRQAIGCRVNESPMRYAIVSIIVVALLVLVRAPASADSLAILIDAHGSLTNGGLTYSNFSASLNFNNPDGTFSVRPSLQSIQITSDSNLFANTLQIRQVQWSGTIDLSIFNASKPELLLAVAYDVSGPVNHVAASQIEPALLGTTITRGDHFVTATLPSGNLLLSLNNSTHLQSIPGSGAFPLQSLIHVEETLDILSQCCARTRNPLAYKEFEELEFGGHVIDRNHLLPTQINKYGPVVFIHPLGQSPNAIFLATPRFLGRLEGPTLICTTSSNGEVGFLLVAASLGGIAGWLTLKAQKSKFRPAKC